MHNRFRLSYEIVALGAFPTAINAAVARRWHYKRVSHGLCPPRNAASGSFDEAIENDRVRAGDDILVLPKVESKIALAAKGVIGK